MKTKISPRGDGRNDNKSGFLNTLLLAHNILPLAMSIKIDNNEELATVNRDSIRRSILNPNMFTIP
jgi:hypothetical protein